MPQRPADLLGELVVQAVDQVADVEADIAMVQPLAAAVAGEEDLLEVLYRLDHRLVLGQRAVVQVVHRAQVIVRLDKPLGEAGETVLESEIGRHGSARVRGDRRAAVVAAC